MEQPPLQKELLICNFPTKCFEKLKNWIAHALVTKTHEAVLNQETNSLSELF